MGVCWRWRHGSRLNVSDVTGSELAGTIFFFVGYGLRRWSKATLGSSFTYEIAAPSSGLIENGPYSLLVHPSYTGALTYCGLGLTLVCGLAPVRALALFSVAVAFLVATRIAQEEAMMRAYFGPSVWDPYIASRYRLIPFLY